MCCESFKRYGFDPGNLVINLELSKISVRQNSRRLGRDRADNGRLGFPSMVREVAEQRQAHQAFGFHLQELLWLVKVKKA